MCKILHNLDQLFELGVHLWGVALAYGKKSDRVGAGGCKVLATLQKVQATTPRACLLGDVFDPDRRRRRRREVHGNKRLLHRPPPAPPSSGVCVLVYYAAISAINGGVNTPLLYPGPVITLHRWPQRVINRDKTLSGACLSVVNGQVNAPRVAARALVLVS